MAYINGNEIFFAKGDKGDPGPIGPQGPKGDKGEPGESVEIVDNLTSFDTDKALSANQGRNLSDLIQNHRNEMVSYIDENTNSNVFYPTVKAMTDYVDANAIEVVDNLESENADKALSANMGRELKETADELEEDLTQLNNTLNAVMNGNSIENNVKYEVLIGNISTAGGFASPSTTNNISAYINKLWAVEDAPNIYFDDINQKALICYCDDNGRLVTTSLWITKSPIDSYENNSSNVAVMFRNVDGSDADTEYLKSTVYSVGEDANKLATKEYVDAKITEVATENVLYVDPNGNDSADGKTPKTALCHFDKAIELGATVIMAKRGLYEQSVTASDGQGKKISIVPYEESLWPGEKDWNEQRKKIEIVAGKRVTSWTVEDGLDVFAYGGNDYFNKVFTTKELTPSSNGGTSDNKLTPNACIFQSITEESLENRYNVRLFPVLTKEECSATDGTFYWDGTNVYIHPFSTAYNEYYVSEYKEGINISGYTQVVLEDVTVIGAMETNFKLYNNMDLHLSDCISRFTAQKNGISLDNSNAELRYCIADYSRQDGFNMHGYGNTQFIDCKARYNCDDGLSHHQGCTGTIIGGEYNYNTKGGVVPTYGAEINVYNASAVGNAKYGIMYASTADFKRRKVIVNGCVAYRNGIVDLYNDYYEIVGFNNHFKTKNVNSEGTLIDEIP